VAMRDIGSHVPHLKATGSPKALGNRRSGRAGEPAAGESVRASESLDDVPHRPRLASYPPLGPTDRPHDLYGSLSALLGTSPQGPLRAGPAVTNLTRPVNFISRPRPGTVQQRIGGPPLPHGRDRRVNKSLCGISIVPSIGLLTRASVVTLALVALPAAMTRRHELGPYRRDLVFASIARRWTPRPPNTNDPRY
jgi:hypothetical protein